MSVSLSEVLAGAEAQAVPLSAECAGYLVLAAADQAALSPRRVQAGEVCLLDDGAVRLLGGVPADDATAEGDLRELLGGLLSSASSSTAGLTRARRRAAGAGIGALLRELERALIPVNRAAARRALARLARETVRAKDEGRLTLAPAAPRAPTSIAASPAPVAAPPAPVTASPAPVTASPAPATASPAPVTAPPAPVAPVAVSGPVEVLAPAVLPAAVPVESATPPGIVTPVALEAERGLTEQLPRVEVTERLELPFVAAAVASVVAAEPAPVVDLPAESETRPEPVVLRASQRAPAMPSAPLAPEPLSVVPPPVRDLAPTGDTPVLGTVLVPSLVADEPRLSVEELALSLATPELGAADELEIDVEWTFSDDESTIVPEEVELFHAEESAEPERTEPCPSPLPESVPPPAVAAVADIELPDDLLASAPSASEFPEVDTKLPPWVTARPDERELSPLPHVALPRPRESNVEDLLGGMQSEAFGEDELRSGLKGLAGLEPTPSPPDSPGED
jgi:hypothetical protein